MVDGMNTTPSPRWPGLPPSAAALPDPNTYTVYRWGWAPHGLATRRQLASIGLRPGRQEPRGEIRWKWDRKRRTFARFGVLYSVTDALPKRTATPRQLAALAKAMTARRTCPQCRTRCDYCIPTSLGMCLDCHDTTRSAIYATAA